MSIGGCWEQLWLDYYNLIICPMEEYIACGIVVIKNKNFENTKWCPRYRN